MGTGIYRAFGRFGAGIALSLAVLALVACGGSSEPEVEAPAATTASAETAGATASSDTQAPAPAARMAPTFELPNAAGETVSLASYTGDKNVVLVFYRGFW